MKKGEQRKVKDVTLKLTKISNLLTVSKREAADYRTIQGAIDTIPVNNTEKVEGFIHNGIYKEVVTISKSKPFVVLKFEGVYN